MGGGRVLYLHPEVAPSETLVSGFKKDYGRTAVVFHGRMTEKQREEAWRALRGGRASLVAGTRSALFLETGALRLIAVDDEQEESYFQAENPSYDARRGAVLRARSEGAVAVFGSSRPTVEAFDEARRLGILVDLGTEPRRAAVTIVDHAGDRPIVSRELEGKLRANLEKGQPAILFLNRRGYAAQIVCSGCGRAPRCPRCDIALVYHKTDDRLICHYCNFAVDARRGCAGCGGEAVVRRGAGTQAVEEELGRLFPGAGVARFDADTASKPADRERILADFAKGRTPLLVATQLLVHQAGVPKAGLVAILRPEYLLGFSDYRAGQKTFEAVSAMLDLLRDAPDAEGRDPDGGADPLRRGRGRGGRLPRVLRKGDRVPPDPELPAVRVPGRGPAPGAGRPLARGPVARAPGALPEARAGARGPGPGLRAGRPRPRRLPGPVHPQGRRAGDRSTGPSATPCPRSA